LYNQELKYLSLRYTNNDEPKFTDQEIMTLYLYVVQQEQRFSVQQIYDFTDLAINANSFMLTPVKAVKGQHELTKQRNKAADDLFSKAVSTVRQPIESLFNWLIAKTDIQRARKVRSTKGLLVHVFGKIAAAFIYLIF